MITEQQYLEAWQIIKGYKEQLANDALRAEIEKAEQLKIQIIEQSIAEGRPIHIGSHFVDAQPSVRLYNILKREIYGRNEDQTLWALRNLSKKEFLRFRDAGKKTLDELVAICELAGIKLKEE